MKSIEFCYFIIVVIDIHIILYKNLWILYKIRNILLFSDGWSETQDKLKDGFEDKFSLQKTCCGTARVS